MDADADTAPDPSPARTVAEFANRLRLLKIWAGNPSLRRLERLSGLPRSTIADALNPQRKHLPALDVVRRFVRACGVADQVPWELAWRRLQAGEVPRRDEPAAPGSAVTPHQIPADVYGIVGRTRDLKELDALLEPPGSGDSRPPGIAIISGSAGVGKTTLAVHWAHRVSERFPDGQLYVNLRGQASDQATTPEQALAHFLRALGVPGEKMPVDLTGLTGTYRSITSGKRVLVVLDNATDVAQVRPLVPGGFGCLTLVTGRDRLTGLVAREGAHRLDLGTLAPEEAPALLSNVLGAERVVREESAAAELARLCGHLPLALRIAAANLADRPQQTIAGYVAELSQGNRLSALAVEGDEEAAVRAAFDLSYTALSPPARKLFRLLGLAPAPELVTTAVATLLDTTDDEAGRLLRVLAGAHLIEPGVAGRHGMHDLLRLYADERAQAEDAEAERAGALRRLSGWYLRSTIAAMDLVRPDFLRLPTPAVGSAPVVTFVDGSDALAWLDGERPNLVALIGKAAALGQAPVAWLLTDALRGYYWLRRHTVEWLALAQAGLAAAEQEQDLSGRAAMQLSLGTAYWSASDHRSAGEHFRQAVELNRAAGDRFREISALGNLAGVYSELGEPAEAAECYAEELAFHQEAGDTRREARARGNLGLAYLRLGRLTDAAAQLEAAVAIRRAAGEVDQAANALGSLGVVYRHLGRLDSAVECLDQARQLNHALEDRFSEAAALDDLARVHRDAGHPARALESARQALILARESGSRRIEVDALITVAALERAENDLVHARRLAQDIGYQHGEADALVELADYHRAAGALPQALEHGRDALALARATGQRILEAQALTALAAAYQASGDTGQAVEAGRLALEIYRATGHRLGAPGAPGESVRDRPDGL